MPRITIAARGRGAVNWLKKLLLKQTSGREGKEQPINSHKHAHKLIPKGFKTKNKTTNKQTNKQQDKTIVEETNPNE